jgi:PAS domain S-box-containing protein
MAEVALKIKKTARPPAFDEGTSPKPGDLQLLTLFQNHPDGLLQAGADGIVRYANPAGHAILARFGGRVGRRLPRAWLARIRPALRARKPLEWEVDAGDRIFVFKLASPAPGGPANLYVRDITEHRKTQDRLAHELYLMNVLMDTTPDHIYFKDRQGRFVKVNSAKFSRSPQTHPADFIGKTDFDIFTAEHAQQAYADEQRIMRTGKPLIGFEEKETWPDGTITWVHTSKVCLHDKHGKVIGTFGISRDITRQKELQREILAISEREQRRIGHDLHDDLCQQLAGISFLSQSLATRLAAQSVPEAGRAKEIAQLARRAINQTRDMAHGLAPLDLEADSLRDALLGLAANTRNVFRCDCRFHGSLSVPLPDPGVGTHLYRIAQEAISNAIKHGKASRIDISLGLRESHLTLAIGDNGTGLPKTFDTRKGMGLRIMQYRAGLIGGTLEIRRRPRGGTLVACVVPERSQPRNRKRRNHKKP